METMTETIKSKVDQVNPERREGPVATAIEEQTAKMPSDLFLWASVATMAASLGLKLARNNNWALFVGMWAHAFLMFGIYNKQVKQLGHDRVNQ